MDDGADTGVDDGDIKQEVALSLCLFFSLFSVFQRKDRWAARVLGVNFVATSCIISDMLKFCLDMHASFRLSHDRCTK